MVALTTPGCIDIMTNGKHSGQVTAIEKEGLIWKTWKVYVKSDISSSQEDTYCVEDVNVIEQLTKAAEGRNKITVLYKDELIVAPWRCGTYSGGIITGIEMRT